MQTNISITKDALELLSKLKKKHNRLLFVISGGCCDNTAPMLLADFIIGDSDVLLGEIEGVKLFISKDQAKTFEGCSIEIGVIKSHGGGGFSLETPYGKRFTLKTDICIN